MENIKKKKIEKLVGTSKRNKCCRRKNEMKPQKQRAKTNNNTVVNISNAPLSKDKHDLLSRGLSFCPRPSQIDDFQLREDIQQFFRRLRLKEFFMTGRGRMMKLTPLKNDRNGRPPAIEIQPWKHTSRPWGTTSNNHWTKAGDIAHMTILPVRKGRLCFRWGLGPTLWSNGRTKVLLR